MDGGHHKQWYLEEIIKAADVDLEMLKQVQGEWEESIAP
jgi:hypothetical protein